MKNNQSSPDNKAKKKRAQITVEGRVQGVFYRAFTKKVADSLELNGYVRNLSSGNVEIVVEGCEDKIKTLIDNLWVGPPLSVVTNVILQEEKFKGEFSNFSIKY